MEERKSIDLIQFLLMRVGWMILPEQPKTLNIRKAYGRASSEKRMRQKDKLNSELEAMDNDRMMGAAETREMSL